MRREPKRLGEPPGAEHAGRGAHVPTGSRAALIFCLQLPSVWCIDVKGTLRRADQLMRSDKKPEKHKRVYPEDERERLKRRQLP